MLGLSAARETSVAASKATIVQTFMESLTVALRRFR